MSYYLAVLKNYAGFSGRARRAEYWMFVLINLIISIVLNVIARVADTQALLYVALAYAVATIVPGLAVAVRRLHDTGKSGAWIFIALVPIIGGIWLLVLLVSAGVTGPNQYGSDPKQVAAA